VIAQAEARAAELRRQVAADPRDRVGWHNLAAVAGDLGRAEESERAARQAITLGIAAPETRLVLARALIELRRLDEAERAFEQAIALRASYVEAHYDLAQLRWMRTGRVDEALRSIDEALRKAPADISLLLVRAIALEYAGQLAEALAAAQSGLSLRPDDVQMLRQSSHLCAALGAGEQAAAYAQRAVSLAPADAPALISLCEALLACGRIAEAEAAGARLQAMRPSDQHAIALRATAWRLLGDPRYQRLHDYGALVQSAALEVPAGWSQLGDFLRDLADELERLHSFRMHPFQQSVRGGGQLNFTPADLERPLVRALFGSLHLAIQGYVERLGTGDDPIRSRNSGRFAMGSAWSVRLASGGYHTDHVHPFGWLSSAFYVTLPPDMSKASPRAGWLRLGKPGIATRPALEADFHVEPRPGHLVLFPAYMWHGVEPFESERPRMTVAFDALPA
jgi:tetratricopeptide (TPR) repeat protein